MTSCPSVYCSKVSLHTHSLRVSDVRQVAGQLQVVDDFGSNFRITLDAERQDTPEGVLAELLDGDGMVRVVGQTRVADPAVLRQIEALVGGGTTYDTAGWSLSHLARAKAFFECRSARRDSVSTACQRGHSLNGLLNLLP
jgi:RecB family exonuclease